MACSVPPGKIHLYNMVNLIYEPECWNMIINKDLMCSGFPGLCIEDKPPGCVIPFTPNVIQQYSTPTLAETLRMCSRWAESLHSRLEIMPQTYAEHSEFVRSTYINRGLYQVQEMKENYACDPDYLNKASKMLYNFMCLIRDSKPSALVWLSIIRRIRNSSLPETEDIKKYNEKCILGVRQILAQLRLFQEDFLTISKYIQASINQTQEHERLVKKQNDTMMFKMDDF